MPRKGWGRTRGPRPDPDGQVMRLAGEIGELRGDLGELAEKVDRLIESCPAMREATAAAADAADECVPYGGGMSQDQIRELILREVKVGESFHPSDIAIKHGLDFDTVLKVVDMLHGEGRMEPTADARDAEETR